MRHVSWVIWASVAEIQNTKSVPDAVSLIKNTESWGGFVSRCWLWRNWSEHGRDKLHIQQIGAGPAYGGLKPTNSPCAFEIHAFFKIGDDGLSSTLRPVEGFTAKDTEPTFTSYERGTFEIMPLDNRARMHEATIPQENDISINSIMPASGEAAGG